MRKSTFRNIEAILRDYPDYEGYIRDREMSLLHPDLIDQDENSGGGRGSTVSNPTERKALTIAEDRTLWNLKYQKRCIEKILYQRSDILTQAIIKMYYFDPLRMKTWNGVAGEMGMSVTNCIRLRDRFFDKLADELGLMK